MMKPTITLKYQSPPVKHHVKFVIALLGDDEIAHYAGREDVVILKEMLKVALIVRGYTLKDYIINDEVGFK